MIIQQVIVFWIGVVLGFVFGMFLFKKRIDIYVCSDKELTEKEVIDMVENMANEEEKENDRS